MHTAIKNALQQISWCNADQINISVVHSRIHVRGAWSHEIPLLRGLLCLRSPIAKKKKKKRKEKNGASNFKTPGGGVPAVTRHLDFLPPPWSLSFCVLSFKWIRPSPLLFLLPSSTMRAKRKNLACKTDAVDYGWP